MIISAVIVSRKTFSFAKRHKGVVLFLVFLSLLSASIQSLELSSDFVERDDQPAATNQKLIYKADLEKVRVASRPRKVSLADSQNYQRYGSIVVDGILFTFKSQRASKVFLVTEKSQFKKMEMEKNQHGVWYALLVLSQYDSKKPDRRIHYKFLVDDLFFHDPAHNNKIDDGSRGFISYTTVPEELLQPRIGVLYLQSDDPYGKRILFRIKADKARTVSLVGTFNNWNSELDVMEKDEEGYFYLEKHLDSGEHLFSYKIDGERKEALSPGELRLHPVFGKVSYLNVP